MAKESTLARDDSSQLRRECKTKAQDVSVSRRSEGIRM
jgi:hypothetical protein